MIYDNAMQFVMRGIAVIPIRFMDKRPLVAWERFKSELPTTEQLKAWFSHDRINYGVVAGWTDLVVIDFDTIDAYNQWSAWVWQQDSLVSQAFTVYTARGVHVYVRIPHLGRNRKLGKIDVKGNGYVLGPGSTHPSGAQYLADMGRIFIPVFYRLDEIFPVELLTTHTELPAGVRPPATPSGGLPPVDPWVAAMHPRKDPGLGAVEKIRKQVRIEQFFTTLTDTSHGGRWKVTLCPFHDDQHPSFWLDTERQICNCLTCNFEKPLDVINLYARLYGIDNSAAIQMLARTL
jgi:hypothetical protein